MLSPLLRVAAGPLLPLPHVSLCRPTEPGRRTSLLLGANFCAPETSVSAAARRPVQQLAYPLAAVVPVESRETYSVWLTKQRTGDSTQLTAKKYIKIVQASVLQGLRKRKQPGSSDVPRASLLHDRDPAHQSKEFAAFAERSGIRVAVLPPRSPDLDPLDYGVFGTVKNQLEKEVEQKGLDWSQRCSRLVELLEGFNPDAAIIALPGRIERCIAARGGHFE